MSTPINYSGIKENSNKLLSIDTFSYHYENNLPTLEEVVQKFIEFAVDKNGGAKDKTAKEIGIDRKTLYKRINTNS